jgi:hypothetical protein
MRVNAVEAERRWYREIEKRLSTRFRGVYLAVGFAALMAFALANTQRLMHNAALLPVSATIVALGTDSSGEPTMTSTFQDAEGNWHRDTQPASYHYARGEPRVGESIAYLYGVLPSTGLFYAVPRADGILKWMFGVPAAIFALFSVLLGVLILRERAFRRHLVQDGKREALETPRIGHRDLAVPAGASGVHRIQMWRLEGRYWDSARNEYVEAASDWQPLPVPTLNETDVPPVLVDPQDPSRYWLPVGALGQFR